MMAMVSHDYVNDGDEQFANSVPHLLDEESSTQVYNDNSLHQPRLLTKEGYC